MYVRKHDKVGKTNCGSTNIEAISYCDAHNLDAVIAQW
jgi:hypothetical protein